MWYILADGYKFGSSRRECVLVLRRRFHFDDGVMLCEVGGLGEETDRPIGIGAWERAYV